MLRQWRLPRARQRVKGTCTRTAKDQPLLATAGARSQPTVNEAEIAFPVKSTNSPILGLSLFSRTVVGTVALTDGPRRQVRATPRIREQ
jgi:hypothetical protein